MMLKLINFSQEAVFQLETEPTNTMEFVKALNSLDEINNKVCMYVCEQLLVCAASLSVVQSQSVEDETTTVKDLYELIEKYGVPVPPEDLATYQVTLFIMSR